MSCDFIDFLTRLKTGEIEAQKEFIAEYAKIIARNVFYTYLVGSKVQNVVDFNDLIQETFFKAFLKIQSFEGKSKGELWNWTKQIASRLAIDLLRKKENAYSSDSLQDVCQDEEGSIDNLVLDDKCDSADKILESNEIQSAIFECVEELQNSHPDYYSLIIYRYYNLLSYE
jgi:RNA polymerase sigma factor (sigma-70 family)